MGKLKTSLTALATIADAIEKKGEKVLSELTTRSTTVQKTLERVNGGYELLYMYLKQKANQQKVQITAWHKDTIKAHTDSKVAGFISDIEKIRGELIASFKTWEDAANLLTQGLAADVDRALADVKGINAQIDKKKKKWFQSAKYKTKIAGYEASLDALASKLRMLKVDISTFKTTTQSGGPKKIASLQLTDGKTIAQVFQIAEKGLSDELEKIQKFDGSKLTKLLRNYGSELKQIRTWVADADAMEAEAGV
jgi:hypothetical protein